MDETSREALAGRGRASPSRPDRPVLAWRGFRGRRGRRWISRASDFYSSMQPFDVVLLDLNLPLLSGLRSAAGSRGEPVAAGHHLQRGHS